MSRLRYEELLRLGREHTALVTSVAFSPDQTMLATCGLDGKLCIWSWTSGQLLFTFLSKGPVAILSCLWIPQSSDRIVCGLGDGTIAEYSFVRSQRRASVVAFRAHQYPIEKLALSNDYLASGAQQELRVWKQAKNGWKLQSCLRPPEESPTQPVIVTSLNWTEDQLIATYMYHGIVFYKLSDWTISRIVPYQSALADASVSLEEKTIAISKPGDGFEIYALRSDFVNATHIIRPPGSNSHKYPLPVRFTHNGYAVLLGGYEGVATLWDVTSGLLHQDIFVAARARTTCIDAFINLTEDSASEDQFTIAIGYVLPDNTSEVVLYAIKSPGKQA